MTPQLRATALAGTMTQCIVSTPLRPTRHAIVLMLRFVPSRRRVCSSWSTPRPCRERWPCCAGRRWTLISSPGAASCRSGPSLNGMGRQTRPGHAAGQEIEGPRYNTTDSKPLRCCCCYWRLRKAGSSHALSLIQDHGAIVVAAKAVFMYALLKWLSAHSLYHARPLSRPQLVPSRPPVSAAIA